METLDQIGLTTRTDKASFFHDYLRTYEEFFSPLRHAPVRLLEMGVLGGASLVTWAKYFDHPEARIDGMDTDTLRCQRIQDRRVRVIQGSQTDASVVWPEPFDIIIDDAGHFASQQIAAFGIYWEKWLKPGGLYVIEDLHTYASPMHCDGGKNIIRFLNEICIELHGKGDTAVGKVTPNDKWASIETLTFRKGMAVFRKRL